MRAISTISRNLMKRLLEKEGGFFFRFDTFAEMGEGLKKVFSPSASSVIKKVMGQPCGERSCRRIMREARSKEEALNLLSRWKSKENWGELTFQNVNLEKGSGRITIKNSFETKGLATPYNIPCCHFFRGFLAGFLSELLKKSITVIEKKCAAKGDEHCEFRFASSHVLYVEEAIQIRNKMIQEMALEHTPKE